MHLRTVTVRNIEDEFIKFIQIVRPEVSRIISRDPL